MSSRLDIRDSFNQNKWVPCTQSYNVYRQSRYGHCSNQELKNLVQKRCEHVLFLVAGTKAKRNIVPTTNKCEFVVCEAQIHSSFGDIFFHSHEIISHTATN